MAARNSTSRVRRVRNSGQKANSPDPESAGFDPEALHRAIEQERSRLMDAEAVLHCAMIALDEDDRWNTDGPYYQSAIGVARDIVIETIEQLDSVKLRPFLGRPKPVIVAEEKQADPPAAQPIEVRQPPPRWLQ